jgi:hypothetical protein
MNPHKAEFTRLIASAGWSPTEAAKRLGKTPAAINHLLNPNHSNKPTRTTLLLLRLLVAAEGRDARGTADATQVIRSAANHHAEYSLRAKQSEERCAMFFDQRWNCIPSARTFLPTKVASLIGPSAPSFDRSTLFQTWCTSSSPTALGAMSNRSSVLV